MAELGKSIRSYSFLSEVIPNAVTVEKGHVAYYDTTTDTFKVGAAANAALIPVGYFTRTVTGTGAVVSNIIELFDEVRCVGFRNALTNTVVAADRFSPVYVDGDSIVCNLASGRSVAGRFIRFTRPEEGYNPPLCMVSVTKL